MQALKAALLLPLQALAAALNLFFCDTQIIFLQINKGFIKKLIIIHSNGEGNYKF